MKDDLGRAGYVILASPPYCSYSIICTSQKLKKRNDYDKEADKFERKVWTSGKSKRLPVNIWDYGLENEGRRDLKFIFSVTSLTREVLRDSILLTVTASSARACPKFLAMIALG